MSILAEDTVVFRPKPRRQGALPRYWVRDPYPPRTRIYVFKGEGVSGAVLATSPRQAREKVEDRIGHRLSWGVSLTKGRTVR